MKLKQILLFSFSLLLVSLLPTRAYGDQSSQSIGDNNKCVGQIINSHGSNITCNNIYINHPEASERINQPHSTSEIIKTNPDGYTPIQNPPPQISNLGGYTPKQNPPLQMSTPGSE